MHAAIVALLRLRPRALLQLLCLVVAFCCFCCHLLWLLLPLFFFSCCLWSSIAAVVDIDVAAFMVGNYLLCNSHWFALGCPAFWHVLELNASNIEVDVEL